jgi:hypothetical protein
MLNKIRNELMKQDDEPLSGDVEVDETAWGGRPRQGDIAKFIREGETDQVEPVAAGSRTRS